ncbi:hypothetical protein QQS21_007749 [Conoideocrella luteorostrata]|uniref:Xaa-Pro aminopeptidase n=1 Tax=Conoideocrella luteorostrata TaxID=1105319 RepID=A0AAJ0CK37_9HYPO|nr:hypothetical protein QQS21_007749 [Conoideocrella luteorostrata]
MDYDLILDDEFDALCLDVRDQDIASAKVKYPAKQHARRVVKELDVEHGIIYLPGQPERLLEDSDQPRLFRQRRYFYYLSGANFEDCAVTYEIGHDRLTLWIPYIEPRQVLWFGSKPSAAECLRRYDVDEVRYTTQLNKFFRCYASSPSDRTTYILHPDQAPNLGSGARSHLRLDHSVLQPAMDRARLVKTEYEVAMIRHANNISSAAHRKVAERITRLKNEREIEAIIQAVCIANGTRYQAYPVIAGSGVNGSTLHYNANNASLKGKQCVVLDAGCEWECYASDITRTLPISGCFPPKAAAIHAIVQRMQNECIRQVRPGKLWHEIHLLAASIGMDGLLKLGILKGDTEQVARAGTVAAFFPHGLGHHVGLEVHDVSGSLPLATQGIQLEDGKRVMVTPGMLAQMMHVGDSEDANPVQQRKRQRLLPNMVVTVEPGIYFCREYLEGYFRNDPNHSRFIDWEVLEGYYEVGGVRIEDCILVTRDGFDNLTVAPKGDELLDVINRGRK